MTTQVTIEAVVMAPIDKVWSYWTEPLHITKWNFASDDWCCPKAENDLKPGGQYKVRMEAKDGSFGFDLEGVYDEILIPNKLSHTMNDGRKVSTSFETIDMKVKVITIFDADSQNAVEMQRAGWQAILNNFKAYAESH